MTTTTTRREQQRTLQGCGLSPLVDTCHLPNDPIECTDGTVMPHQYVTWGINGEAYSDDEQRHEAECEYVKDVLDKAGEWATDHTSSQDYGDEYCYLAAEDSYRWPELMREWMDQQGEYSGMISDRFIDRLCDNVDQYAIEAEYDSNEYAAYYGNGCELYSFDVGEYHDQFELSNDSGMDALHEAGRLEDILEDIDRYVDVSLGSWNSDWVQGSDDYPHLNIISTPGGVWHMFVSEENMRAAITATVLEVCHEADKWRGYVDAWLKDVMRG